MTNLPFQERVDPTADLELDRLPINRILGLNRDLEKDVFYLKPIRINIVGFSPQSAGCLSSVGFLASYVFPIKVLIQELLQEKTGFVD